MRKQGDHSAVHPEKPRIIPRLAPGGLYEKAIPRLAVGLAPDIPRLAPRGFLGADRRYGADFTGRSAKNVSWIASLVPLSCV
jgi:hypothetical protein